MKAPRRPPAPTAKDVGNAAAARPAAKSRLGGVAAQPGAGKTIAKAPAPQAGMRLHTAQGARKYLTAGERDGFLREAERLDRDVRTLCADRVDLAAGVLVLESLKKRSAHDSPKIVR